MDLYAYSQIEDLEQLLEKNEIKIQRLRGLRLMKNEELISDKEIEERIAEEKIEYAVNWLKQRCDWSWSSDRDDNHHKSFIYGKNEEGNRQIIDIDFSKVHGKDRKHIKYKWKVITKKFTAQFDMWNRYVGKNVLYVHARQGGDNRLYYPIDIKHPMYLDDIDDAWDSTYCDIYYDLDKVKDEINKNL